LGVARRHFLIGLLFAPVAIAALVVLYRVDPSQSNCFPRCPLHEFTGLHCPGCGSTRAMHSLLHGRVAEALRCNPLLVVGLPCVVLFSLWRYHVGHGSRACALATLAIVMAYGVARNIPCYPFKLLAPHTSSAPVSTRIDGPNFMAEQDCKVGTAHPLGL
jgi:hypothetical protein